MFYDNVGVAFNHDNSQNSYQGNPLCTLELWTTLSDKYYAWSLAGVGGAHSPKDNSYSQILLLHMNISCAFIDKQCTSQGWLHNNSFSVFSFHHSMCLIFIFKGEFALSCCYDSCRSGDVSCALFPSSFRGIWILGARPPNSCVFLLFNQKTGVSFRTATQSYLTA